MSNIVKAQNLLSQSETEFSLALSEPRFLTMELPEINRYAYEIVMESAKRIGQNDLDEGIFKVAVDDLVEALQGSLKQMTVKEIKLAIKTQSRIDKSFSISSRVIFEWVNTWRTTKKLEIQRAINIKQKNLPPPPAKELTKEQKVNSIQNEFKRHTDGLKVRIKVYAHLEQFGFVITSEMKFNAIDKAIPKLIRETNDMRNEWIKSQVLSRLKELKECDPKKPIAIVIAEAQRIIITDFFNDCMSELEEPKDRLKL